MTRGAVRIVFFLMVSLSWSASWQARAEQAWREDLVTPRPEYSQMPFWFWNDALDDEEIRRQMADFRDHGVYGFVIHARMGLSRDIPYMGERWLSHVRSAVQEAARTNMRVCLYDEGMYPSGSAHGEVVQTDPSFAARGLQVAFDDLTGPTSAAVPRMAEGEHVATLMARREKFGEAIKLSDIRLVEKVSDHIALPDGQWRIMTFASVPSGGHIRGVHEGEDDRDPGAPAAADLLNPNAMQAFIRLAYEPYRQAVGEYFGTTVIGMFTDEPSMLGRGPRRGLRPWTEGLAQYFEERRGYALTPVLPALFYDVGPQTGKVRRDFQQTLAERLEETYYRPLSRWCEAHGVALTGHPAGSSEIRPLRWFQIPGQDLVWRYVEPGKKSALEGPHSTMAKCSSSVARHDGRRRNSNEIYGAFGWQLTMDEMKWAADWMMVRGVNLLYPHAFYYSIRDYRVHERPPDVGPHNAWWPHYRRFADYTSRLCGLLTDSRQVCDVAILGSNHALPWRAAKWLYQHQVDFNYLEEWRLCEQAKMDWGGLEVGDMRYTMLIIDQDEPLSGCVAERVAAFDAAGGQVRYCRGQASAELLEGIARDVMAEPPVEDLRSTHLVKEDVHFYLLVNEGELLIEIDLTVSVRGRAEWFDAWSGRFSEAPAIRSTGDGMTVPLRLDRRESIVLCVDPDRSVVTASGRAPARELGDERTIEGPWLIQDAGGQEIGRGLGDWTEHADLAGFSGTLAYQTTFDAGPRDGSRYELDLGKVADLAVVRLNGRTLDVRFWAPYVWDVTDAIKEGQNRLTVQVTNSLANRYDPKNKRPSGLFGPVTLTAWNEAP